MRKPAGQKFQSKNPQVLKGRRGKRGASRASEYLTCTPDAARTPDRPGVGRSWSAKLTVLTMLNAYPGISSADTAQLSMLTRQTLSVIVANLEEPDGSASVQGAWPD